MLGDNMSCRSSLVQSGGQQGSCSTEESVEDLFTSLLYGYVGHMHVFVAARGGKNRTGPKTKRVH